MIFKLLFLCAALYGASGKRFEVVRLPRWFYPTNKYVAKNLVDSTRPRPNERLDLLVKFPFLGNHLCSDQEWWTYGEKDCVNSEGFSSVWVNKNGILSFGDEWRDPFLNSFARVLAFPAIAPLWALLGFGDESAVYYEQVTRKAAFRKAKRDIRDVFACAADFEPQLVVVVTWYRMDTDQECVTNGNAWCHCLVRNDKNYCICDALPINEYCDCVAANDPDVCECVTEISERTPHCDCLRTRDNEYCQCVFEYGNSESFCKCIEDTGNPDFCGCLDYGNYGEDFCECVYIFGNDYYDCLLMRKKRDVRDEIEEQLEHEWKLRNKRDGPDRNMRSTEPSSTFQAVLITDGIQSYVIFHYESIELQKTLSGTIKGIVGMDGGMRDYPYGPEYNNQFSYSDDLNMLITETNAGQPGRWMFRVDGDRVLQPSEC